MRSSFLVVLRKIEITETRPKCVNTGQKKKNMFSEGNTHTVMNVEGICAEEDTDKTGDEDPSGG